MGLLPVARAPTRRFGRGSGRERPQRRRQRKKFSTQCTYGKGLARVGERRAGGAPRACSSERRARGPSETVPRGEGDRPVNRIIISGRDGPNPTPRPRPRSLALALPPLPPRAAAAALACLCVCVCACVRVCLCVRRLSVGARVCVSGERKDGPKEGQTRRGLSGERRRSPAGVARLRPGPAAARVAPGARRRRRVRAGQGRSPPVALSRPGGLRPLHFYSHPTRTGPLTPHAGEPGKDGSAGTPGEWGTNRS